MIMKRILNFLLIPAAVLCMGLMTASKPSADRKTDTKTPIYLNTSYSFEERAVDLVSRLTLEEKQSLIGNSMAPTMSGARPFTESFRVPILLSASRDRPHSPTVSLPVPPGIPTCSNARRR